MQRLTRVLRKQFGFTSKLRMKQNESKTTTAQNPKKKQELFLKKFEFESEKMLNMEQNLSPRHIHEVLDKGVIGQASAKKVSWVRGK